MLKQMVTNEASLRITKEELENRYRQTITDCEDNKLRMTVLNRQNEKPVKEKDAALMRLTEVEDINHKMSEELAEAVHDKQKTAEALIVEKNMNQDIRSKFTKISETKKGQGIEQQAPQTLIQDELPKDTLALRKSRGTNIGERESGVNANSHKRRDERLHRSLGMVHDSRLLENGEIVEADLFEDDLAPKRPKRRISVEKTRESPCQKRVRASTTARPTAACDTPRHDPKPIQSPKQASPIQNVKPQTSSRSASERDEDWDVEFTSIEPGE